MWMPYQPNHFALLCVIKDAFLNKCNARLSKVIRMFYYDLHMTNNELGVKSTCQLLLGVDCETTFVPLLPVLQGDYA
jgi:hypothetical protein